MIKLKFLWQIILVFFLGSSSGFSGYTPEQNKAFKVFEEERNNAQAVWVDALSAEILPTNYKAFSKKAIYKENLPHETWWHWNQSNSKTEKEYPDCRVVLQKFNTRKIDSSDLRKLSAKLWLYSIYTDSRLVASFVWCEREPCSPVVNAHSEHGEDRINSLQSFENIFLGPLNTSVNNNNNNNDISMPVDNLLTSRRKLNSIFNKEGENTLEHFNYYLKIKNELISYVEKNKLDLECICAIINLCENYEFIIDAEFSNRNKMHKRNALIIYLGYYVRSTKEIVEIVNIVFSRDEINTDFVKFISDAYFEKEKSSFRDNLRAELDKLSLKKP